MTMRSLFTKQNNNSQLIALENISANVMIADSDRNIIYMNKAVTEFLREAESTIQKDLPSFRVTDLIGKNIDIFHKKPEHQKHMLEALKERYNATIKVGGRMFDLVAAPVLTGAANALALALNGKTQIYACKTLTINLLPTRCPDHRPSSTSI